MQEARKKPKPPSEVQDVLDLPDSPRNKNYDRAKENLNKVDACSEETRKMIEDIRARQERDKQILLIEHNRKIEE